MQTPDYIFELPPLSPDAQAAYEFDAMPSPAELFIDPEVFCMRAWQLAAGFARSLANENRKTTWQKEELANLIRGMHNVAIYNEALRGAPLIER